MAGKTVEQIQDKRDAAIETLICSYPNCEILDTYFKDFDGNGVQFLGKAIMKLGEADLAVFLSGWKMSRGCKVEELVARLYDIKCLYL